MFPWLPAWMSSCCLTFSRACPPGVLHLTPQRGTLACLRTRACTLSQPPSRSLSFPASLPIPSPSHCSKWHQLINPETLPSSLFLPLPHFNIPFVGRSVPSFHLQNNPAVALTPLPPSGSQPPGPPSRTATAAARPCLSSHSPAHFPPPRSLTDLGKAYLIVSFRALVFSFAPGAESQLVTMASQALCVLAFCLPLQPCLGSSPPRSSCSGHTGLPSVLGLRRVGLPSGPLYVPALLSGRRIQLIPGHHQVSPPTSPSSRPS